MKNLLKLLIKSKSSQGWTLLELIIAACLTLVVVGASGYGLIAILKNNKIATASSNIEYDLNRAVEFMSNEVKSASLVEKNADINYIKTVTKYTGFNGFNPSGTVTPIMFLKLPQVDTNGNNLRVVYYTRTKDSSTPWSGPNIIYRWGPNLDQNGAYTAALPAAWTYEALIDGIANTPTSGANTCKNTNGQWTPVPDNSKPNGFYICVRSDERMAELHAFATADVNTKKLPVTYSVETQVYTRTEGGDSVNSVDKNTLTNNNTAPRNFTIKLIGKDLTCPNGSAIPLTDKVYLGDPGSPGAQQAWNSANGDLSLTVPSQQSVTIGITSAAGSCSYPIGVSYTSNQNQSATLQNGDTLDKITVNGSPIDATSQAKLKTLLLAQNLVDSSGRITIANNQILYFSEVYASDVYAAKEKIPFPSGPDADFNDYIALITVNTP